MSVRLHEKIDIGGTHAEGCQQAAAAGSVGLRRVRAGDFFIDGGLRCVVSGRPLATIPASRVPVGGRFPGDPTVSGAATVLELLTWLAFTPAAEAQTAPDHTRLLHHYKEPIAWLRSVRSDRSRSGPERLGGLLEGSDDQTRVDDPERSS